MKVDANFLKPQDVTPEILKVINPESISSQHVYVRDDHNSLRPLSALDSRVIAAFRESFVKIQDDPIKSEENDQLLKKGRFYLERHHNIKNKDLREKIIELERNLIAAECVLGKREAGIDGYITPEAQEKAKRWIAKHGGPEEESRKIASQYPQLCDMILGSHAHKHLNYFGHEISFEQGEPHIKVDGQELSWKQFYEKYMLNERGGIVNRDNKTPLEYHQQGFVEHDITKWKTLEPFKVLPPEQRPSNHILEVVTECPKDKPGLLGYHAWVRLINPQGEVYSVGYAPDVAGFFPFEGCDFSKVHLLCETVPGKIMNTDITEWLQPSHQDSRTELPIEITPQQFQQLITYIEKMQNTQHDKLFNFVNGNCTAWVANLLGQVGVSVQARSNIHELILPSKFSRALNWLGRKMPLWLKRLCSPIRLVMFGSRNLIMLAFFGAYRGEVNKKTNRKQRFIGTFKDVFKLEKCYTPYALRQWQRSHKLYLDIDKKRGEKKYHRKLPTMAVAS
ncbi:MAG: hypothetical protein ACQEP8_05150 [Chlamydiota bacterium]